MSVIATAAGTYLKRVKKFRNQEQHGFFVRLPVPHEEVLLLGYRSQHHHAR
jgi:hypothetical protein